jgi:hypothetical protein
LEDIKNAMKGCLKPGQTLKIEQKDVVEVMATRSINEVKCIGDGEGKGAKQSLCGIQRQEP